jgi:hypothetical protein
VASIVARAALALPMPSRLIVLAGRPLAHDWRGVAFHLRLTCGVVGGVRALRGLHRRGRRLAIDMLPERCRSLRRGRA